MRFIIAFMASVSMVGCLRATPSRLGAAAAADRPDEVRRMLSGGESVDQYGPGGTTPLIDASGANALGAMAVLLDAGADPNRRDAQSTWTALMHAIHAQHADAVRLLLDRGADANIPSVLIPREAEPEHPHGGLPLLMAVVDGDPAFVSLLLAHGADPRVDGHDGAVVLTAAVSGRLFDETDPPPLVFAGTMAKIASRGGCHREAVRALLAHDPALKLGRAYWGTRQARIVARWNCADLLALVDR
jgi:ankyrin repeat protein